jgi:hypothetical protein
MSKRLDVKMNIELEILSANPTDGDEPSGACVAADPLDVGHGSISFR